MAYRPNNTCFLAYLLNSQTNATGDNTVARVAYDTVVFDTASGFTTGASAGYTFPKSGKYLITCTTTALANAASTFVQFTITATSRGFQIYKTAAASALLSESQTAIIDATAGDTVYVTCAIFGVGKTAQISGGSTPYYTYIEGVLLD